MRARGLVLVSNDVPKSKTNWTVYLVWFSIQLRPLKKEKK
jgi:hypothetical protein